jgi:hypothetical protein
MKPSIEPIPELRASVLVRHHHDKAAASFEADCRRLEHGRAQLFRLRCEGVGRVDQWLGSEGDPDSDYVEITEAYCEPLADGRLLVTFDIAAESKWIEVDCRSMSVTELRSHSAENEEKP